MNFTVAFCLLQMIVLGNPFCLVFAGTISAPDAPRVSDQLFARSAISNHISLDTDQRPLFNIAHMCNSIKKTLTSLARGANAVEVDVTFKQDDIYLYHGYPCDCFRYCWDIERLSKFLTFARRVTTPGYIGYEPNFVILYFDLKLKNFNSEEKYRQGLRFANYLEKFFFTELPIKSTLRLVVSISYAADVDFLIGFIRRLKVLHLFDHVKDRIGFDVGMDSDVEKVRQMWSRLNVTNVWQGEGITNCFNPIIGHQLEKLVSERDSPNSYFQKIYRWTIDLTDSIKSVLRYNIDGVMTNHPERVAQIVQEDAEFAKSYRLATIHDNPFSRQTAENSYKWRIQMGKTNLVNKEKVVTFLQDLKNSLLYFISEIFQSVF